MLDPKELPEAGIKRSQFAPINRNRIDLALRGMRDYRERMMHRTSVRDQYGSANQ
jgi:hypothetical protein